MTPSSPPHCFLYEQETILKHILHQKFEIPSRWRLRRSSGVPGMRGRNCCRGTGAVWGFMEKKVALAGSLLNPFMSKAASGNSPDDTWPASKDKDKALPGFWIPSLTPRAKATEWEKQSLTMTYPTRGKGSLGSCASCQVTALWPMCHAVVIWDPGHLGVHGEPDVKGHCRPSEHLRTQASLCRQGTAQGRPECRGNQKKKSLEGKKNLEPDYLSTNPGSLITSLSKLP